ncbi:MAG: flagellar biosynthesis protein FlhF [Steroidobacterales bacterium]
MKRYSAADMRSALRQVREEQGPDAVLLSTRQTHDGVEICAAIDIELAVGQGTLAEAAALKALERDVAAAEPGSATPYAHAPPAHLHADSSAAMPSAGAETPSVGEELRGLRALLEQQLAALAWNDFSRREPLKARALSELSALGLSRDIALRVVADLPATVSADQAQRLPYALLSRLVLTCPAPCAHGGAVALVGPPGSGKTTLLAKLAVRWVLEHGADRLAILSADDERLGSHEQLRTLGRLLGVRVEAVNDTAQLAARIESQLPQTLLLIDTAGVCARDAAALTEIQALRSAAKSLRVLLVLPASAQAGVLEDAIAPFAGDGSVSCALTRTDEATSLGGVLSAIVRSQVPAAWISEGPRVPEDLRPARAHQLVVRAMELARAAGARADEDLLVRRYGGSVHVAA